MGPRRGPPIWTFFKRTYIRYLPSKGDPTRGIWLWDRSILNRFTTDFMCVSQIPENPDFQITFYVIQK